MSESMLACTLPNGTQILVQLDKEREIGPLVYWDNNDSGLIFEDNTGASELLPGLEGFGNNEHNIMDNIYTLQTNLPVQNVLNIVCSDENIVSGIGEHCVFESTMGSTEIGNDLDKVIEVQQDLNSIIYVGNNIENESVDYEISQLAATNGLNDLKNVALENIIPKRFFTEICDTNISAKNAKVLGDESNTTVTEVGVDACSSQVNANFVNIALDDQSIESSSCVANIGHGCSVQNPDNISSDAAPEACHLEHAAPTESILEQACQSVPLTMEDGDLKNDRLESPSDNVILNHLDDFAEMIMMYKCRICRFTSGSREVLLEHLRIQHLEGKLDSDHLLNGDNKVSSTSFHSALPQRQDNVSEKLVYLCAQCSLAFASIEECREHMMQDHELILHENDVDQNNTTTLDESASNCNRNDELEMQLRVAASDSRSKEWVRKDESVVRINKKARNLKRRETGVLAKSKSYLSSPKLMTKRHLQSRNPVNHKCTVRGCHSKFSDVAELHIHTSCHVTDKRAEPIESKDKSHKFVCCKCPIQFKRWRPCASHLWRAHSIDCGLHTCQMCLKYKTTTAIQLKNHMRIHGEDRSFTCADCGKGFKQSAQLHNHRVMHLDRRSTDTPKWYASQQCSICLKQYADSKCLKKHIQAVHSKLRPYVCQICGHSSARKAMLQLHLRQHTGEKPHSCPLCEYKTGDHNSLRRHVMRHTGQKQYNCPYCPYSAIQSNSYKNHLRSKHPGQAGLFTCSYCNFRTISNGTFALHLSDHKNGVIASSSDGSEVFPGNMAAAKLIYSCLNSLSKDGSKVEANVTGSSTSADGTTQTITIQIPSQEQENNEVTGCFLQSQPEEDEDDEGIDSGGITIPAEPEQSMIFHEGSS